MPSIGKTAFTGASGKAYRFRVYALGTRFRKLSGVYVVTSRVHKKDGGYRHVPLYVGHTEDFSQPFGKHRKSAEFMQRGANCICLQKDLSEESRAAKEEDLVAGLNPACNR
jgi:hypothetical protein